MIELSQRGCRFGVLVLVVAGATWLCVGDPQGRQGGGAPLISGPPLIDVVLDAPVRFIPELTLGLDALDAGDRERLVAHLGRVAASRGGLLHTNVAWNALYYACTLCLGGCRVPTSEMFSRAKAACWAYYMVFGEAIHL